MRTLAARPDGVLVSAETVKDFQLQPGDLLRLRLQDGAHQAVQDRAVPLRRRRQGVPDRADATASSSPTPTYVARATGSDAVGAFLVQTDGTEPGRGRRSACAPRSARRAQVTDIVRPAPGRRLQPDRGRAGRPDQGRARLRARARRAASGLALGARLPGAAAHVRDRRRARRQGAPARRLRVERVGVRHRGGLRARRGRRRRASPTMLVKVLTGVFDPPPDALAVPWGYLAAVVALALGAVGRGGRRDAARAAPAGDRGAARPVGVRVARSRSGPVQARAGIIGAWR